MSKRDPDTELATLVRDAAPRPSAEFLEDLDARVGERFGAPGRPRRAWTAWPKWRIAGGLAAACAAGAIVVVAVGGGGGSGGGDAVNLSSVEPAQTQADEAARSAGAAAPKATAAEPVPTPGTVAPAGPKRRVIRDTQLALTAAPKDF